MGGRLAVFSRPRYRDFMRDHPAGRESVPERAERTNGSEEGAEAGQGRGCAAGDPACSTAATGNARCRFRTAGGSGRWRGRDAVHLPAANLLIAERGAGPFQIAARFRVIRVDVECLLVTGHRQVVLFLQQAGVCGVEMRQAVAGGDLHRPGEELGCFGVIPLPRKNDPEPVVGLKQVRVIFDRLPVVRRGRGRILLLVK